MIDPLTVVFIPGGLAVGVSLLTPLFVLRHLRWHWKARLRNTEGQCGRCGHHLKIEELFLYGGVYVCVACADVLRRRLRVLLPAAIIAAVGFAASSGGAFIFSRLHGGPELAWWLDGRWIPLLAPSLAVTIGTVTAVGAGRRANQLKNAADSKSLSGKMEEHLRLGAPGA